MNLYQLDDYKRILRGRVERLKAQNKRITFQALAKHCQIQNTYLSRVFSHEENHLSSDQLYLAFDFLGFNPEEQRFIQLIYEKQRTILDRRRTQLAAEIELLRKNHLRTESHLSVPKSLVKEQDWVDYYLDPNCQLTHIFLTLPHYAKDAEKIRKKLELPKRLFDQILKRLLRLGVIELGSGGYRVVQKEMHLPADSPILRPYRTLLRFRGLERMQKLSSDDAYTFSVIFSAGQKERKWIQREFLTFLKRVERVVSHAQPTEVFQMNFDLFDWSSLE